MKIDSGTRERALYLFYMNRLAKAVPLSDFTVIKVCSKMFKRLKL